MPRKKTDIVRSPRATAKAALKEVKDSKVKTPEEVVDSVTKELATYGLNPKEDFTIKDPITGEEKTVTLSRTGIQESDLIIALADPNLNRERKDHALSMYLWGRGAESASMIVDIMRYKGEHTKETRVFKSQIRFDFEALVTSLTDHFETQARNTAAILDVDLQEEIHDYKEWLKDAKDGKTLYSDFYASFFGEGHDLNIEQRIKCAMLSEAIYQLDEAEKLTRARTNIALAREREKGGGIYVDTKGNVYDATNPEVDEIIKADREATNDIQNG